MKQWGMGLAGFVLGLVIMIGVGITLKNRQVQQTATNSVAMTKRQKLVLMLKMR